MTVAYLARGRRALASTAAYIASGCGPVSTVGVPRTIVPACTSELASSPASSVVRSKRSTATPRSVSSAVRWSTIMSVLSCMLTNGRQTMFCGSPPAQSR